MSSEALGFCSVISFVVAGPKRTSGLSTPSTLFRKLKRLVVVSEMTHLKFWSWHQLLLLPKRMVGREAALGAGRLKTKLWLSPQTAALQQACNCFTPLSCGQRKNVIRQKVSVLLKRWGERGGNWAVNRSRIYNSEHHVIVEFSLLHGDATLLWMPHKSLCSG